MNGPREPHRFVIHAVNPEHAVAVSSVNSLTGTRCMVIRNPPMRMSNAGRVGSGCTGAPYVD